MKTIPVSSENVAEFVNYCCRYGAEHDESFLPDDSFVPTDEYPAYLLLAGDNVIGAAGLLRSQPYRDKGKARFMIFHSVAQSPEAYSMLLLAIRQHTDDLDYVYGFVPQAKVEARRCWEALDFDVERYVYSLVYVSREVPSVDVPEGYSLMALEQADEVGIRELCDLWNQNYRGQLGFMGATPEYITSVFDDAAEYVPGGIMLLRHGSKPVGTAHVYRDNIEPKAAEVGMLSVHPDYRGRGLGRLMLRKALAVALRNDFSPIYLSVNAMNESAVSLYTSEGFTEDMALVCYRLDIS